MGYRKHGCSGKVFSVSMSGSIQIPAECIVPLDKAPWIPRQGEIITVEDENGGHFRGRVFSVSGSQCKVHLFEKLTKRMESHLNLLLLQALPEKERMEWIIQKATELGVNAIVPFYSKRSISLEEREKRQRKAHRWPLVAQKASRQCRRAIVPFIEPYTDFASALRYADDYNLKILLWERESKSGLSRISHDMAATSVCVLVGPEGGFTEKEVELTLDAGFISISLGPRILRTETAAIAIIAIIQYIWGDLG